MSIERTLERGELKVEIDDWGGVHWHHDGELPLSISPEFWRTVEQARQEVLEE
jgi:hypothetical protein